MSRAFTREDDNEAALSIGERPVSPHRNLVTEEGLRQIEAELARLHKEFAQAEAEGDRERIAIAARDLRYWTARRESAELSVPEPGEAVVRFGMTVTLVDEDDQNHRWRIVGEDEADPSAGKISHVAPLAKALFGKGPGETVTVNGKDWEIAGLE